MPKKNINFSLVSSVHASTQWVKPAEPTFSIPMLLMGALPSAADIQPTFKARTLSCADKLPVEVSVSTL